MSSLKGDGIDPLMDATRDLALREERDIIVIGTTNAGKSTLINQFLSKGLIKGVKRGSQRRQYRKYDGDIKTVITPIPVTSSAIAGTTLNLIPFTLRGPASRQTLRLYDTPGIFRNHTLHDFLTSKDSMSLQMR